MAHNVRIRVDKDWTISLPILSADWQALDTRLTAAINGDSVNGGGVWVPTSAIAIGGAGVWLMATSTLEGATSGIFADTGLPIVHGESDHIELGPGHTGVARQIATCFDTAVFASGFEDSLTFVALVSTVAAANAIVRLRVHNGATFTRVDFFFAVGSLHGPPALLPHFRVFAMDANGVKTPLLTNAISGYVAFNPIPANAAAWYAAGATQTFTHNLDANVVIDTSRYTYWAEVLDEQLAGSAVGNIYIDALAYFTNIADLQPQ